MPIKLPSSIAACDFTVYDERLAHFGHQTQMYMHMPDACVCECVCVREGGSIIFTLGSAAQRLRLLNGKLSQLIRKAVTLRSAHSAPLCAKMYE